MQAIGIDWRLPHCLSEGKDNHHVLSPSGVMSASSRDVLPSLTNFVLQRNNNNRERISSACFSINVGKEIESGCCDSNPKEFQRRTGESDGGLESCAHKVCFNFGSIMHPQNSSRWLSRSPLVKCTQVTFLA